MEDLDLQQVERFIELLPVPVTVLASDGMSLLVNQAYSDVLGLDAETIMSRSLVTALHPDDLEMARAVLGASLRDGLASTDVRLKAADGRYLSIRWDLLYDPRVDRIMAIASDRTVERAHLAEAQRLARTDTLTGLLSRAGLVEALEDLHGRHRAGGLVIALFDVDGFKKINDTFGHQVGDDVLRLVAARLRQAVPDRAAVGRLGGDEFVVVSTAADASVQVLARCIESAFEEPFALGTRILSVSSSIGLRRSSGRETVDDLLRDADMAVYEAKRRVGRRWCEATDDLIDRWLTTRKTERELADSLDTGRFVPWFQPIVAPGTGAVELHEVLMRWVAADGSVQPADVFIDVAATAGLLPAIGAEVRRTAMLEAGRMADVRIALNVAGDELFDGGLAGQLDALCELSGLAPERVLLEITEQTAVQDLSGAARQLARLRQAGFSVAIDDFGSGYSSLTYLTRLPIDIVKLDGRFLRAAADGGRGHRILRALIEFLAQIELVTVVEGVETRADHQLVCELGVDLAQGWYYGRPSATLAALPALGDAIR